MVKRRQLRLGELLRDVIAKAIQFELQDPRLRGLISVTRVEPTPDYRDAKVYVSIYGEDKDIRSSLSGLEQCRGALQAAIRRECKLRLIPKLKFFLDESIQKEERFNNLLNQAMKNVNPAEQEPSPLAREEEA